MNLETFKEILMNATKGSLTYPQIETIMDAAKKLQDQAETVNVDPFFRFLVSTCPHGNLPMDYVNDRTMEILRCLKRQGFIKAIVVSENLNIKKVEIVFTDNGKRLGNKISRYRRIPFPEVD